MMLARVEVDRINKESVMRIPKYIRVYDNGGCTVDRYAIVYTRLKCDGEFMCVKMSKDADGYHGIYHHEYSRIQFNSELGKKIKWQDLPQNCQREFFPEYEDTWKHNAKAWITT